MPTDENRKKELFQEFLKNKKNLEIRNQLIELHYPIVHKLVNKFKHYPSLLQKQDLFQEGILGLIKALDNYQDEGYDFLAYAKPAIKFEIQELIRKSYSSSVPRTIHRKKNKPDDIDFEEWEEATQPKWDEILTPHQLWLKQAHHDIFVQILTKKFNGSTI
ncbi:DNA-Directed RNA Polymerase Sigma Subunit [Strawberry lethal yellows phytoplasma (CPA) str. NZSb11]|uniref:DNA-Directed RNA Polymerase Sigma Subunit n=1 Tax=Strawberry lethal yellows phytoplasma (CPA) str. NZSb11 TaxID=980422 RepID=R4RR27_PHYAS|nr:sigma-70 family RNA polymerase sigma factor [Candidatus Phytoplasma australiense]AGL90941.1 DNA-Directed RNA Polymerase Sigma Subunit [Strawberry lethal yellows phytoplasma (CPA) str. NZSb11]